MGKFQGGVGFLGLESLGEGGGGAKSAISCRNFLFILVSYDVVHVQSRYPGTQVQNRIRRVYRFAVLFMI